MLGSNMSSGSIIAAGHPLAAEGAAHAIRAGGNAVDAAVAGWLVSCLAEPVLTSPGGGGFAMVAPASGQVRLYDFFTQTPRRKNPDARAYPLEADFGSTRQVFHLGAGSVATPGCVAGILRMHADLGTLPLKECAAPALHHARNGVTITRHAAKLLEVVSTLYTATPEARAVFASGTASGKCLQEGEVFRNPDFEAFLDMLVAEGSRWFYAGDIGRMADAHARSNGGHLRREDFLNYREIVREPLVLRRNGATIHLNPPPSMGGTLIALGLFLNPVGEVRPYPFPRADDWRDWIEPLRVMSLVRTPAGLDKLGTVQRDWLQALPSAFPELAEAVRALFPHALPELRANGTTQLSVIDAEGNEVSMTTSNGAGSAVILPDTGFMLNNMLGEEDLQSEGIGTWREDTRLASMMAPTLASLPDGTRIATGSGGSNRIRSTLLQILRHVIDRGADIVEAVEAPRLHWESGEVHAETAAFEALMPGADSLPWPVIEHAVPNLFFGGAHSVAHTGNGRLEGIADPRRGGLALRVGKGLSP